MKTTRQIINQTPKFDITKEKLDYHFNTKWYSEKEVVDILNHNREYIRKTLIKLIERIDYLEGEEFYNGIKKDIEDSLKKIN